MLESTGCTVGLLVTSKQDWCQHAFQDYWSQCPCPRGRKLTTLASTGELHSQGRSGSVSCGVSAAFPWVLACIRFCVCVPSKNLFPWVLWKFYNQIPLSFKVRFPQFSSVSQSCLTLCDPMDCSTPGFPVHHQLPELTQTQVHQVGDAIQPSHPLIPFSCLQSFPATGSSQMSQFFASGGQNIGVSASASVLPMNIQDWFPLGLTGLISLQSKGLARVFFSTTVQKHAFFGPQLSL